MAITIDESLDQITLSSYTSNTFFYVGTGGLLTPTTGAATNGQLLIGSTGSAPVSATLTAGSGTTITNGAGSITISNSGVTSNVAGTGISLSGGTGAVTITNTGVTSFSAGTTGFTPSSASTGAITLSGTLNVVNGGTGLTSTPSNGQLLIGNGTNYTLANITGSTGLSVTNGSGTIALANTGVTSITAGSGILVNAATGAVTITAYDNTVGIVAAAGTTQATATLLPYAYNIVTSGAGGGVIFPAPFAAGQFINIENRTGGNLNIYPNLGAQIESLGANTSDVAGNGSCRNYIADSNLQWYHTTLVISAGTGISLTEPNANDTAVYSINNTGVTSITGTANQITASASTGAVTLSLPTVVITGSYQANSAITASSNLGVFSTSTTLSFTDSEVFLSGVDNTNSYVQACMQNTNAGTAASADFIVNNNLSTSSTYYGDFGINSSGYTGSGSLNLPNATYLVSQNGDLTIGTQTSNAIHFVINGGAFDAMTITTAGVVNIGNAGGTNGVLSLDGSTSGTITIQPQVAAGTYNFNLPTTAGTAGQVLTSQGGGSTAMTWTSLGSSAVTSFSAGTTGFTPSSATTGAITLAGTLNIANGGTGQTTALLARGPNGLNIDERSTFSNTNYTCLSTDRYVAQTGTLTASVTITLPAASSVNAGQSLEISDESGSVSGTNYFNITPNGTDTLNGGNASKSFRTPYQRISLISNGSNGWYYDVVGLAEGGTGSNTIFTQGSVVFAGAGGTYSQDNTKIFWDNTNYRLGIGTASPAQSLDLTGTGVARVGAVFGASTTPTIAYGTGAGTSPSTTASIGSQLGGYIAFSTGTTPAVGTIFTMTVPIAAPNYVLAIFSPANAAAAGVMARIYSGGSTASTFALSTTGTALAASTAYAFNYQIISF